LDYKPILQDKPKILKHKLKHIICVVDGTS